ncbi:hypothetical protein [Pseudobutyrivibrio sp. MD2005]|uniref:hypothetical protein n=1 Tax=Pseudobutyrivibrio sp. MD2005 TaxID=1410616 RepID=UPI0004829BE8|nr:hypothetical protein [Pseudobutyrivibrio sp. MD2005]
MNFKKILPLILTSSFIVSMIPATAARAEEADEQTDAEIVETIDYDNATEVAIEEYVYWEMELENSTLSGYTQMEYGCLLESDSDTSTKELLNNISEEETHDRVLSILDELELPEKCPSDIFISYYVQKDGSITDVTCEYTESDSDEEDLENPELEKELKEPEALDSLEEKADATDENLESADSQDTSDESDKTDETGESKESKEASEDAKNEEDNTSEDSKPDDSSSIPESSSEFDSETSSYTEESIERTSNEID